MREKLTPPGDLRPAQLGVVLLGQAIPGHISATFADLEQRGFLRIEEIPGDDQDWLLTDLRDQAARGELLRFEATLLDGLFEFQSAVKLEEMTQVLIPLVRRVQAQVHRDAVRRGWLHRGPRRGRTEEGEELLAQIQSFRMKLRARADSGDAETMARLAPYAIGFGLGSSAAIELDVEDASTAGLSGWGDSWGHPERFAAVVRASQAVQYGHGGHGGVVGHHHGG